jgi:TPR repeat protein
VLLGLHTSAVANFQEPPQVSRQCSGTFVLRTLLAWDIWVYSRACNSGSMLIKTSQSTMSRLPGCRFRAAAEHNHASAQYGLGYMHLVGHGVAMNHRKAYKYFSSAAEQVWRLPHACCFA